MKKTKLSKKEIEIIAWVLEKHKDSIIEKLRNEKDPLVYTVLFRYNMELKDLTNRLRLVSSKTSALPIRMKDSIPDFSELDA